MKKDFLEIEYFKMRTRARVKMRTFAINLALTVVIWLLSLVPAFLYFCVWASGMSATMTYFTILGALGLWQLINIAFYLAPALAMFIESKHLRYE